MDFTPAAATIAQQMIGGIDSFALLAIPFFILSSPNPGDQGHCGRLSESAMAMVGFLPGSLALVNVMSCMMMFGAISGSAVAATSAMSSFMVPEMKKHGYSENFAAAVTTAQLHEYANTAVS